MNSAYYIKILSIRSADIGTEPDLPKGLYRHYGDHWIVTLEHRITRREVIKYIIRNNIRNTYNFNAEEAYYVYIPSSSNQIHMYTETEFENLKSHYDIKSFRVLLPRKIDDLTIF